MTLLAAVRRIALVLMLMLPGTTAWSQSSQTIRITADQSPARQINMESGGVDLTAAGDGWVSARWIVEPAENPNFVYLKNAWTSAYLVVEASQPGQRPALTSQVLGRSPGPQDLGIQWQIRPAPYSNNGKYLIMNYRTRLFLSSNADAGKNLTLANGTGDTTSLMWNLENYSPPGGVPEVKQIVLGGTTIRDGSKISFSIDGMPVRMLPIDGQKTLAAVLPQVSNAPATQFYVKIVDANAQTVWLHPLVGGYNRPDAIDLMRVSYWSGLEGYRDFSRYSAADRNIVVDYEANSSGSPRSSPRGQYMTFKLEDAGGGAVFISEDGAYLFRFCCVPPGPNPGDVFDQENIIAARFSAKTGAQGRFVVRVH